MPNPITTTGTTNPVTTTKLDSESTSQWVGRHNRGVNNATPNGNELTTTYTSSGGSEAVTTTRLSGETDALFLARHQTDYLERMDVAPPVP